MNLWQYAVLLEGLGAVGTAAAVAREALKRDPFNLFGYANAGVMLIALSTCANLLANVRSAPNVATWIAALGFALYGVAVIASWVGVSPIERLRDILHHDDPRHGASPT